MGKVIKDTCSKCGRKMVLTKGCLECPMKKYDLLKILNPFQWLSSDHDPIDDCSI